MSETIARMLHYIGATNTSFWVLYSPRVSRRTNAERFKVLVTVLTAQDNQWCRGSAPAGRDIVGDRLLRRVGRHDARKAKVAELDVHRGRDQHVLELDVAVRNLLHHTFVLSPIAQYAIPCTPPHLCALNPRAVLAALCLINTRCGTQPDASASTAHKRQFESKCACI